MARTVFLAVVAAVCVSLCGHSASALAWEPEQLRICIDGGTTCSTWSTELDDFSQVSTSCSATTIDSITSCDYCEVWKVVGYEGWDNADGVDFWTDFTLQGGELRTSDDGWFWDGAWDSSCDFEQVNRLGYFQIVENGEIADYDYESGEEIVAVKIVTEREVSGVPLYVSYCMEVVWD